MFYALTLDEGVEVFVIKADRPTYLDEPYLSFGYKLSERPFTEAESLRRFGDIK